MYARLVDIRATDFRPGGWSDCGGWLPEVRRLGDRPG
jgi:hypothetical protein